MKHRFFILIIVLSGVLITWESTKDKSPPIPNFPPYPDALQRVEEMRLDLANRYQHATSLTLREEILAEAKVLLVQMTSDEVLPQWLGTPWDFNGTTETPREGAIACGYFVTTVLRDVGFKLQRVRLAQQASELIIKSLTTETHIKRFSNVPIESFVTAVQKWGYGLYVVGLDIHTGFILHNHDGVFFIHASYGNPSVVVKEMAKASPILCASKYRVLGRISADDTLLLKWLQGKAISTLTEIR